ncbi:unnamed protein product [Protopolystoma xenopodis]|uniref:Uncharacterized protein n=1 Tax=Protopolystoma xenopodis TaxID=117903 RepID=A0A448WH13_9PLAT|nr:unnamed protein product [Protopolystoma xenopodis]
MQSCSDHVCHGGTDESLAQLHHGRKTVGRELLRTIQQSSLRGNPPSVSGETTSRMPSNQLFLRNGESSRNLTRYSTCVTEFLLHLN